MTPSIRQIVTGVLASAFVAAALYRLADTGDRALEPVAAPIPPATSPPFATHKIAMAVSAVTENDDGAVVDLSAPPTAREWLDRSQTIKNNPIEKFQILNEIRDSVRDAYWQMNSEKDNPEMPKVECVAEMARVMQVPVPEVVTMWEGAVRDAIAQTQQKMHDHPLEYTQHDDWSMLIISMLNDSDVCSESGEHGGNPDIQKQIEEQKAYQKSIKQRVNIDSLKKLRELYPLPELNHEQSEIYLSAIVNLKIMPGDWTEKFQRINSIPDEFNMLHQRREEVLDNIVRHTMEMKKKAHDDIIAARQNKIAPFDVTSPFSSPR